MTLLNLSVVKGARAVRSAKGTKNGRAVKFPARPRSFVFLLEVYLSLRGLGGGDEAALVVGAQHLALAVERVVEVVAVEDYEARVVALGDAVARDVQRLRGVVGAEAVRVHNLLIAHHLADVEPHEDDVAHVARSERIPRVEDVVVAERDVVAVRAAP